MKKYNITIEEIVADIANLVEDSEIENKDKVIRYIKKQYNVK